MWAIRHVAHGRNVIGMLSQRILALKSCSALCKLPRMFDSAQRPAALRTDSTLSPCPEAHTVKTLEIGILGPDDALNPLCGGVDYAVSKRKLVTQTHCGCPKGKGSIQLDDLSLLHDCDIFQSQRLVALLGDPLEDFQQRDRWHHQGGRIFYGPGEVFSVWPVGKVLQPCRGVDDVHRVLDTVRISRYIGIQALERSPKAPGTA